MAGGLARYFGIDSTLIRLVFVILGLAGGGGILIYIVLAILIPERKEVKNGEVEENSEKVEPRSRKNVVGLIIVGLGLLALIGEIMPGWWNWELVWPLVLIGGGMVLIFR